ncbi:U32 family peptidase [Geothrix sp. PMB-07]|uniref:peptidase U32 family protein n=1 Tax=Geothrix sp. PMB-07 TaxID=3068640 RepID=UPI002741F574|nr:U32 family peptidase [Geothrix sp. PMB-07]WLT32721.1 U32 family peptidase [Geothrix sp. PMB-07]
MTLELLAPAKNADQGILALRCGADAVYMGGPQFGARQAAGNELKDFELLTAEARLWGAKVFATLNTILFDGELDAARRQAWELYEAGVDALILQDMAFLEMDLPPIPIHASTQAVCDSPEKVAFLASAGFSRAILAREVSLDDIRAIHGAADIELEAFVFGALCVGESGQCYLSGAICERSGNRGECAQPCRAPWNLIDASNHVLVREKHLLNIRDLDLSDHLEAMADAGIQSFKIEGRLKDADYVKNIVSQVRRKLDLLLHRRPELGRASLGAVSHAFTPDPTKTFQRGLSSYRIDGERQRMGNLESGKHLGEFIGQVRSIQGDRLVLDTTEGLHPGDGLAFVEGAEVAGTVINAVEPRQLFVQDPSRIKVGTRLHRNLDLHWLKALRSAKVERRIAVKAALDFPEGAVRLRLEDSGGFAGVAQAAGEFAAPRDVDASAKAIHEALGRLGNTPFELADLQVAEPRFVPLSVLNSLRRDAAAALEALRRAPRAREPRRRPALKLNPLPVRGLDFSWNIANRAARAFYERAGGEVLEPAAELHDSLDGRVVMTTRHCVKYELGWCHVHDNPEPWARIPEPQGPLFLENGSTRLECRFDCARCRMELVLHEQGHARVQG